MPRSRTAAAPTAARAWRVEPALAQVVDRRPALERERALEHALGAHLPREVERRHAGLRGPNRHRERQRGLPASHVAAQHDEVLPPEPAAKHPVERGEPARHRIRRRRAGRDRVDPPHHAPRATPPDPAGSRAPDWPRSLALRTNGRARGAGGLRQRVAGLRAAGLARRRHELAQHLGRRLGAPFLQLAQARRRGRAGAAVAP